MTELKKREWVRTQSPKIYEIAPCTCGDNDCQWSEFEDRLWCEKCQKDFEPEHWGVFSGPIAVQACAMLGLYFDKERLSDGVIEFCEITKTSINWIEIKPEEYAMKFKERLAEIPLIFDSKGFATEKIENPAPKTQNL